MLWRPDAPPRPSPRRRLLLLAGPSDAPAAGQDREPVQRRGPEADRPLHRRAGRQVRLFPLVGREGDADRDRSRRQAEHPAAGRPRRGRHRDEGARGSSRDRKAGDRRVQDPGLFRGRRGRRALQRRDRRRERLGPRRQRQGRRQRLQGPPGHEAGDHLFSGAEPAGDPVHRQRKAREKARTTPTPSPAPPAASPRASPRRAAPRARSSSSTPGCRSGSRTRTSARRRTRSRSTATAAPVIRSSRS
jgi:hypothetical protein